MKLTGRIAHRRVGASGGCIGGRENVLAVGNCCYVAVWSAARGASAPMGAGEGRVTPWRPPTDSLFRSQRSSPHTQVGVRVRDVGRRMVVAQSNRSVNTA